MMDRRKFTQNLSLIGGAVTTGVLTSCSNSEVTTQRPTQYSCDFRVSDRLSKAMYDKAFSITQSKVRGGNAESFFKKPFIDAAFSKNLFLWDTCFMVCFTRYHADELPVAQALDNFYGRMEPDGFICREYRQDGRPLWPKSHPVSINPPLLAFAEWELYQSIQDKERLSNVYPSLKKNFEFHVTNYQGKDGLFWGDTLGMGMDNIPRYPKGWTTSEGNGLTHHQLDEKIAEMTAPDQEKLNFFIAEYVKTLQGVWNKQGRLVDFTAQMGLYALRLKAIAKEIGLLEDLPYYDSFHKALKEAVNAQCWNEQDGFYYDLGLGEQIKRKHIGMYWTLLAELVPEERVERFLAHLSNPTEFYRKMPLPALSASDPDYKGWGDYWLGGVWAPTTYMVLKGLTTYGQHNLAHDLALKTYQNVAQVFEATGTFWENYAPDLVSYGMPARRDFCGWTGLIPIAIYNEYIKT